MTPIETRILTLSDAGQTPAQIAAALQLRLGKIYSVLRAERPDRNRAPRPRTSVLREKVLALAAAGVKAARIAFLLRISRARVYKLLGERVAN